MLLVCHLFNFIVWIICHSLESAGLSEILLFVSFLRFDSYLADQSPDQLNAVTSVFCSIPTIIAPHAGNLTEMTPASQINLHAISMQVSLRNSKLRLNTGVGMSGNRRHRILAILARKMIWTYWVMTWRRFLALKQTLKVLLIICFLRLHVHNPYVSSLCL